VVVPSGIAALLRAALDTVFDDLVNDLAAGVRIDSRNPADGGPGESEFQRRYGELLEDAGAQVDSWEIDTAALTAAYPWITGQLPGQGFTGRPVVVGWLPSAERARETGAQVIPRRGFSRLIPDWSWTAGCTGSGASMPRRRCSRSWASRGPCGPPGSASTDPS
jgi:hypothetical protein